MIFLKKSESFEVFRTIIIFEIITQQRRRNLKTSVRIFLICAVRCCAAFSKIQSGATGFKGAPPARFAAHLPFSTCIMEIS